MDAVSRRLALAVMPLALTVLLLPGHPKKKRGPGGRHGPPPSASPAALSRCPSCARHPAQQDLTLEPSGAT